jgi:WD40 repeat protein
VSSDYKEFYNYDEKVESISFNSVGNICAIAQNESIVILNLDDETNQVLQILTEHTELIKRVNFNSDGKMIVSVSKDGIVKLWKLDDNKLFQPFGKAVKVFEGDYVSFFDDDKIITANRASEANPSYEIKLWTLEGQLLKSIISKTKKFIFDLIFSQDHKTIISIAQDCIVEFWNLDNNSSKAIQLGSGYFSAVSFSPDWGVIAVASYESDYQTRIKLWNLNLTEALEEANRYIGDYQNQ